MDGERVVRESLRRWFTDYGYVVETAGDARKGLSILAEDGPRGHQDAGDGRTRDARYPKREAWELLLAHDWPDNVRELESAIERAMTVSRPPLRRARDLTLRRATPVAPSPIAGGDRSLAALEKTHIQRVLAENGGNVSGSARELGIDRFVLGDLLDPSFALDRARGRYPLTPVPGALRRIAVGSGKGGV